MKSPAFVHAKSCTIVPVTASDVASSALVPSGTSIAAVGVASAWTAPGTGVPTTSMIDSIDRGSTVQVVGSGVSGKVIGVDAPTLMVQDTNNNMSSGVIKMFRRSLFTWQLLIEFHRFNRRLSSSSLMRARPPFLQDFLSFRRSRLRTLSVQSLDNPVQVDHLPTLLLLCSRHFTILMLHESISRALMSILRGIRVIPAM